MQLATMPLDRVPVASLDLETTGLRARTDRIVQIGAIRSDEAVPPFTALVRPGVSIPVTSTRIHGIDDEMVAAGPPTRRGSWSLVVMLPTFWTRPEFPTAPEV